jgi:hypothetical protein
LCTQPNGVHTKSWNTQKAIKYIETMKYTENNEFYKQYVEKCKKKLPTPKETKDTSTHFKRTP